MKFLITSFHNMDGYTKIEFVDGKKAGLVYDSEVYDIAPSCRKKVLVWLCAQDVFVLLSKYKAPKINCFWHVPTLLGPKQFRKLWINGFGQIFSGLPRCDLNGIPVMMQASTGPGLVTKSVNKFTDGTKNVAHKTMNVLGRAANTVRRNPGRTALAASVIPWRHFINPGKNIGTEAQLRDVNDQIDRLYRLQAQEEYGNMEEGSGFFNKMKGVSIPMLDSDGSTDENEIRKFVDNNAAFHDPHALQGVTSSDFEPFPIRTETLYWSKDDGTEKRKAPWYKMAGSYTDQLEFRLRLGNIIRLYKESGYVLLRDQKTGETKVYYAHQANYHGDSVSLKSNSLGIILPSYSGNEVPVEEALTLIISYMGVGKEKIGDERIKLFYDDLFNVYTRLKKAWDKSQTGSEDDKKEAFYQVSLRARRLKYIREHVRILYITIEHAFQTYTKQNPTDARNMDRFLEKDLYLDNVLGYGLENAILIFSSSTGVSAYLDLINKFLLDMRGFAAHPEDSIQPPAAWRGFSDLVQQIKATKHSSLTGRTVGFLFTALLGLFIYMWTISFWNGRRKNEILKIYQGVFYKNVIKQIISVVEIFDRPLESEKGGNLTLKTSLKQYERIAYVNNLVTVSPFISNCIVALQRMEGSLSENSNKSEKQFEEYLRKEAHSVRQKISTETQENSKKLDAGNTIEVNLSYEDWLKKYLLHTGDQSVLLDSVENMWEIMNSFLQKEARDHEWGSDTTKTNDNAKFWREGIKQYKEDITSDIRNPTGKFSFFNMKVWDKERYRKYNQDEGIYKDHLPDFYKPIPWDHVKKVFQDLFLEWFKDKVEKEQDRVTQLENMKKFVAEVESTFPRIEALQNQFKRGHHPYDARGEQKQVQEFGKEFNNLFVDFTVILSDFQSREAFKRHAVLQLIKYEALGLVPGVPADTKIQESIQNCVDIYKNRGNDAEQERAIAQAIKTMTQQIKHLQNKDKLYLQLKGAADIIDDLKYIHAEIHNQKNPPKTIDQIRKNMQKVKEIDAPKTIFRKLGDKIGIT